MKIREGLFFSSQDFQPLIPCLVVGLIFLSEGIQKILFPESVGAVRFAKIGFDNPEFWALFVASFEIVCGTMVFIGFLTRIASIPLLIIMFTALITTKIPILLEKGFWQMAHDSRTDFATTMLLLFLIIFGAGRFSADEKLIKKKEH